MEFLDLIAPQLRTGNLPEDSAEIQNMYMANNPQFLLHHASTIEEDRLAICRKLKRCNEEMERCNNTIAKIEKNSKGVLFPSKVNITDRRLQEVLLPTELIGGIVHYLNKIASYKKIFQEGKSAPTPDNINKILHTLDEFTGVIKQSREEIDKIASSNPNDYWTKIWNTVHNIFFGSLSKDADKVKTAAQKISDKSAMLEADITKFRSDKLITSTTNVTNTLEYVASGIIVISSIVLVQRTYDMWKQNTIYNDEIKRLEKELDCKRDTIDEELERAIKHMKMLELCYDSASYYKNLEIAISCILDCIHTCSNLFTDIEQASNKVYNNRAGAQVTAFGGSALAIASILTLNVATLTITTVSAEIGLVLGVSSTTANVCTITINGQQLKDLMRTSLKLKEELDKVREQLEKFKVII